MCVPTLSAVAVTLESVLGLRGSQFSVLQTLKVRTFPESTGVAATEMRDGARSGLGAEGAASGLPPSLTPWASSGMVDADCGTTGYSIVEPAGLAGKTAHPAVCVGSTAV